MTSPPYVDDKAKGAFIGLSTDVKRGALFRAVLEGLAFGFRQLVEALWAYPVGPTDRQFYAIGGGTRNQLLMQIKATVHNRPILVADVAESTALGAALLGGLGAGVYPNLPAALATIKIDHRRVEPVAAQVAFYDACYERVFRPLYPALRELHHQIYDLQLSDLIHTFPVQPFTDEP
jgi:xylulokinase